MNKTSPKGVLEIAEAEGIVLGPYKDSVGVWTVYVGHTAAAGGLDPSSMPKEDTRNWTRAREDIEIPRALDVFTEDLKKYEARVNNAVSAKLKQHQFDALMDFDFNTGGIYRANLTKQINSGDMSGSGFMGWTKPKEIIKRRKASMNLFRTGNYDANGEMIPIWDALGDGRIRFRRSINGNELMQYLKESKKVAKDRTAKAPESNNGLAALLAAIVKLLSSIFGAKK